MKQQHAVDGTSTDLVIRDRKQKVDDWVNENIRLGRARAPSSTVKDIYAAGAGRQAAQTADLSGGRGGSLRKSSTRPKQLGA